MNFSITINGEGAELATALKTLREVMDGKITDGAVTATIQQAPVQQFATPQHVTPQQAATAYQAQQPYSPPAAVQQQFTPPPVDQQQFAPPTGAVPTSAPTYSMEQLGVAAGPLVDAGRGPELTGWLNHHGAAALTQLDKAHYGEFATFLRSLGAKI